MEGGRRILKSEDLLGPEHSKWEPQNQERSVCFKND